MRKTNKMMKIFALIMASLLVFSVGIATVAAEDNVTVSDDNVSNVTVPEDSVDEVLDGGDDVPEPEVISTDVEDEIEAGITPDSPLYVFDRLVDRLTLSFTFDPYNRGMKAIKIADERLAEMEEMMDEDNLEAAEEAEEQHEALINETEEIIEEIEGNGGNETEEALEEVLGVKMRLMSHAEKIAFVKTRILQRKEAQGKDPARLAHMAMVFDRVVDKARVVEAKMDQKRDRIKTRLKVLAELSEEEISQLEEKLQERVRRRIANEAKTGDEDDEDELEVESEEESEENDSDEGSSDDVLSVSSVKDNSGKNKNE